MVPTTETIPNTGPRVRVRLIKAIVIIVAQIIHLRNAQHTEKHAIHVIRKDTLSPIAGQDNEARARMENGDLPQTPDNPDVINMKLPVPTTEIKVMTPTGSKYCSVEVYVQTLNQTFTLMRLMVKEFIMCLLT